MDTLYGRYRHISSGRERWRFLIDRLPGVDSASSDGTVPELLRYTDRWFTDEAGFAAALPLNMSIRISNFAEQWEVSKFTNSNPIKYETLLFAKLQHHTIDNCGQNYILSFLNKHQIIRCIRNLSLFGLITSHYLHRTWSRRPFYGKGINKYVRAFCWSCRSQ